MSKPRKPRLTKGAKVLLGEMLVSDAFYTESQFDPPFARRTLNSAEQHGYIAIDRFVPDDWQWTLTEAGRKALSGDT